MVTPRAPGAMRLPDRTHPYVPATTHCNGEAKVAIRRARA